MAKRGKKYQQVAALVNSEGEYTLEEACDLVKKLLPLRLMHPLISTSV